jgi:hypothetical protein
MKWISCPSCKSVLRYDKDSAPTHCPECETKFACPSTGDPAPLVPTKEVVQFDYESMVQTAPVAQVPKKQAKPIESSEDVLYCDQLVTVWPDGAVEHHVSSVAEARHVLRILRSIKKQLRLRVRYLNLALRQRRHEYTDETRTRFPMLRGGGNWGQLIRAGISVFRYFSRVRLATDIRPLHDQRQSYDHAINAIDDQIIALEAFQYRQGHS